MRFVFAQAALYAAARATRELEALPEVALGGEAICAPPLYIFYGKSLRKDTGWCTVRLLHCSWPEVDPFGAQMGVELAHLQVITMCLEFTAPRSREKLAFPMQAL